MKPDVGTPIRRIAIRTILAAAVVAAPVVAAGTAAADPVAAPSVSAVSPLDGSTTHLAGYDAWYYWHCQVRHEWWRPRCHPLPPPPPPAPMPFTGSS
ncbi:hypothetical protein [Antrihabitans cavernicola]|uniref:Uncharacterized protein n=1 Tax=Antrihabitans cavernicola TaxID=2495913 RepID=A0A5A7S6G4_9NOCA|nr:hypothetical protein [Spelaeibacter cavernicola]KAA0021710.1 hypothetical protein FOY51_17650 [Spelaeibacter cavernicola]